MIISVPLSCGRMRFDCAMIRPVWPAMLPSCWSPTVAVHDDPEGTGGLCVTSTGVTVIRPEARPLIESFPSLSTNTAFSNDTGPWTST